MNTASFDLPDVQSRISTSSFKLTRVGVTGVKKLVHIKRPNSATTIPLVVTIDLFVDLPADQKGSHMSRNLELISDIIDENLTRPIKSLEHFCKKTAELLLKRHEYATKSEVKASADYFKDVIYPSGKKGNEPYTILAEANATSDGTIRKLIGIQAVGMTACPCAMEVVKEIQKRDKELTAPTHNQRNIGTLIIETPHGDNEIDADDLIQIAEESFSSPTYSILKRKAEAELVIHAHENTRFVEDVVREMLRRVLDNYPLLPDDVVVVARSESEESIHKHNAYAERVTTLGELRL